MNDLFSFKKRYTPRWLILVIDIILSVASILFAYLLRFNFDINNKHFENIINVIYFIIIIRLILFFLARTYAGIIRYTGTKDAVRIMIVILVSNTIYSISNIISYYYISHHFLIPYSIILIDFFISIFLLTAFRLVVKTLYMEANSFFKPEKKIIIYGIEQNAITVKRVLARDNEINYIVEAFIDPHNLNANKKLDGITVYKANDINKILEKYMISDIIITEKNIKPEDKQAIVNVCLSHNIKVKTIPEVNNWINGELSYKQIKDINIRDLLERPAIKLDKEKIRKDILNKTVLVTGAAGSIGKEIVIQLTKFNPKRIIILDQAESPLYSLELELREKHNFQNFEIIIGDVTNFVRMTRLFEMYIPNIVFHAAAYKHVPMMENNPSEAVRTNVLGTKTIADLSMQFNVDKFVMVSTDKAVRPTNVMGASKRIAEIYCQTIFKEERTKFVTTRFGNVLGSNGSVIPRFREQIENGGPVTVTHPEITRFFMTIPEACQLVLQAGALGNGGEIFIFDMGKSVKIVDLAKKMIKLSGLELGKDINLKFTGLRPGEKLYEELLNDKENTIPTSHPKIMVANVREYSKDEVVAKITKLILLLKDHNNFDIVKQMKLIVDDFSSKNSIYEKLDLQS